MSTEEQIRQVDERVAEAARRTAEHIRREIDAGVDRVTRELRQAFDGLTDELPDSLRQEAGLGDWARTAFEELRDEVRRETAEETRRQVEEEVRQSAATAGGGGSGVGLGPLRRALAEIDRAGSQAEVLDALVAGSEPYASRALLVLIRPAGVSGWSARGFETDPGAVRGMTFDSADEPWASLTDGGGPRGLEASTRAAVGSRLESQVSGAAVAIPMVLRDRVAAALYADRLDDGAEGGTLEVEALQCLVYTAALALETLTLRNRPATATLETAEGIDADAGAAPATASPVAAAPDTETRIPLGDTTDSGFGREPALEEPAEESSSYETPSYETPSYETPSYEEPSYEELDADEESAPMASAPAFSEPAPAATSWATGGADDGATEEGDEAAGEGSTWATVETDDDRFAAPAAEAFAAPASDPVVEPEGAAFEMEDDGDDSAVELVEEPASTGPSIGGFDDFDDQSLEAAPELEEPAAPRPTLAWNEAEAAGDGASEPADDGETATPAPPPVPPGLVPGAETQLIDTTQGGAPPPSPTPGIASSEAAAPEAVDAPAASAPPIPAAPAEPGGPRPAGDDIGGPVQPPEDIQGPGWAFAATQEEVDEGAEPIHEEARRLARLLVSEILLYNQEEIEEGRQNRDIYDRLKDDIDRSRQLYEERVDPSIRDSTDYFYQELVRQLAAGDAKALGI